MIVGLVPAVFAGGFVRSVASFMSGSFNSQIRQDMAASRRLPRIIVSQYCQMVSPIPWYRMRWLQVILPKNGAVTAALRQFSRVSA